MSLRMKFTQALIKAGIPELLVVISLFICAWSIGPAETRIAADGQGYYEYLPSIFIRGDFVRHNLPDAQRDSLSAVLSAKPYVPAGNGVADKYSVGVAVLELPFFLTAHALADAGDDGYSAVYQDAMLIGALVFLFIGLIYLRLLLRTYGLPFGAILIAQLFVALGTSLMFYTYYNTTYSHVFSFTAITAFLYYIRQYFSQKDFRYFIRACMVLGLILLLRQANLLVVLAIPFLTDSFAQLKDGVLHAFRNYRYIIIGGLLVIAIFSLQMIAWYLQAGVFWTDTYASEHFDFSNPHFFEFLFGFRKGLFAYAPVLLLSLFGLIMLVVKKQWYRLITWTAFIVVLTFILSSWWDWGFGCTFGNRPFIDYYALFAFPLAVAFAFTNWIGRSVMFAAGVAAIYLSVFQVWQYNNYYLHWDSMDYNKYRKVFLCSDEQFRGILWKRQPYGDTRPEEFIPLASRTVPPYTCDTLYMTYLTAPPPEDQLILVEFEGFVIDDDQSSIEVTLYDSTGTELRSFDVSFLVRFRDDSQPGHCYNYFRAQPNSFTGKQLLMVRLFTRDKPAVLGNPRITFLRSVE